MATSNTYCLKLLNHHPAKCVCLKSFNAIKEQHLISNNYIVTVTSGGAKSHTQSAPGSHAAHQPIFDLEAAVAMNKNHWMIMQLLDNYFHISMQGIYKVL